MYSKKITHIHTNDNYYDGTLMQELDNIYGMFRTRGILHQKAYQHKTVKAVEKM